SLIFMLIFFARTLSGQPLQSPEEVFDCRTGEDRKLYDRFFDIDSIPSGKLIVAISPPTVQIIRRIQQLQKEGVFPVKNVIVVGIYHENETKDYGKSEEFVNENNLGWVKFHRVEGRLIPKNIFLRNPCTPDFQKIFDATDGIVLFGGDDMPPEIYGKKTNLLTEIETPRRHYFEISLIFHLLGGSQNESFQGFLETKPDYPILGICLGCQSLNVGTGGTLIQDIWSKKYGKKYYEDVIKLKRETWHKNPYRKLQPEEKLQSYNLHRIKLFKNRFFHTTLGFDPKERPIVISSHHQAVEKLGKGIEISATSLDGKIVEAIEHKRFPNVLGVQFHPDFSELWDRKRKIRILPEDQPEPLRTILEEDPPSFQFHKEIWFWFIQKLKANHNLKHNQAG
ncbi:gamma-glutamyl-gamma-aminobutyrate hydrolase family protein, partial [bacterium]|nr:gamma-glutamyl-gamma-aminobutyrate hydrolase family protein [bacterium]